MTTSENLNRNIAEFRDAFLGGENSGEREYLNELTNFGKDTSLFEKYKNLSNEEKIRRAELLITSVENGNYKDMCMPLIERILLGLLGSIEDCCLNKELIITQDGDEPEM